MIKLCLQIIVLDKEWLGNKAASDCNRITVEIISWHDSNTWQLKEQLRK